MAIKSIDREYITQLSAGRDMDELVAARVMGWSYDPASDLPGVLAGSGKATYLESGLFFWWTTPDGRHRYTPPEFSADIAAAWQVVEKLRESLPVIRLSSGDIMGKLWQFHVADRYRDRSFDGDRDYFANAETPALAICRTALLACVEPKP